MSRPLCAAPGVAPSSISEVARCPVLAAAHAVSHRLRNGFGAISQALAILASLGWQPAGRPTETIDECFPRVARAPLLPPAAGVQ